MAKHDLSTSLRDVTVVDLGSGMATAIAAKLLADLGAKVHRFEPESGDPFSSVYPAYQLWHSGAKTVDVAGIDAPIVHAALAKADVCIVGGEDFPGYDWSADVATLAKAHPRLIIVEVSGHSDDPNFAATELFAQARSGLSFEQYEDRPIFLSFAPASYCAVLHAVTGLLAALCQRERDGSGHVVRTSLYEGALTLGASSWMRASRPVGGFNFAIPANPHPLIFKCRDGRYIHFVLGSYGSKGALYGILGIDDPLVKPEDSGMPTGRGEAKNFFGDVDLLADYVARFDSAALMTSLQTAGIAANFVMAPGECWDDPQVDHSGVIATIDGTRGIGLPIRGTLSEAGNHKLLRGPAENDLPLAGIRVLDFGIFVAGPYAGVALADLGADVIKVETPQGDPNRGLYRSYASVNRGKRALTVDLKTPEGQEVATRLIASAHVVLNNFRPGVSARLGLNPAAVHAVDPDKIVLESTGFGRTGPYGDRPGFDMIFQAFCGHEIRGGGDGAPPMWDRTAMVDYLLGLLDQVAVLVALWRRLAGGGGADLDASLLDAGLFLMSELTQLPDGSFAGAPLVNSKRTGFHPAEAFYQCSDGWIAIAARGDAMAGALAKAIGLDAPVCRLWGTKEQAAIEVAMIALTMDEAIVLLSHGGVWVERCCLSGDTALHEKGASDLVLVTDNPIYGEVRQLGALFRIDASRKTSTRGAPRPGEHSRELLVELGYAETEITALYERKILA